MTMKTISKVIAAALVAALCFAMVFTGAVSAESATCTVTGYSYSPGAVDVYVGYEVTFESSSAFTAGSFTITPPADLRFIDCTAKASSVDGYVPNVYLNVSNNKVLFAGFSESATNDIQSFTSLALVLKFTPTTAIKDSAAGKTWNITVDNITITNTAEASYTCTSASGTAHVHNFTGATTANGVTTSTCSVTGCGAKHTAVVPGATIASNNLASEKHATLRFSADGGTVLCALVPKSAIDALGGTTYFTYKYKDDDADYKYATTTKDGENGDYYVFPCGRNGGIGRISRNIVGNFINVNGSGTTVSAEWSYSIKSYLEWAVTNADAKTQNYAKALWNYAYYTTERLTLTGDFTADLATYTSGVKSVANCDLPDYHADTIGTDSTWSVSGISVTTGFVPKLNIWFDIESPKTVTVKAYSDHDSRTNLVYKKTMTTDDQDGIVISDIPTKYLNGDIVIECGTKSFVYGFGRYAARRLDTGSGTPAVDANVFRWMMNYAYYLGQAYA